MPQPRFPSAYLDALDRRVLIYDGAMGTNIQRAGLSPKDFGGQSLEGCNDNLVLTRPDVIQAIHESFLAVGCDVVIINDLIESDRGTWEGQSVAELARSSPQLHAAFERGDPAFVFPGGESLLDQVQRTRRALTEVAAGAAPALVVAHAGTIRAALVALGRPVPAERELAHAAIVEVRWDPADRSDRQTRHAPPRPPGPISPSVP